MGLINDKNNEFDINRSTDATYLRSIVFRRFKDSLIKKIRYPIIISINRNTSELYYLPLTSK